VIFVFESHVVLMTRRFCSAAVGGITAQNSGEEGTLSNTRLRTEGNKFRKCPQTEWNTVYLLWSSLQHNELP